MATIIYRDRDLPICLVNLSSLHMHTALAITTCSRYFDGYFQVPFLVIWKGTKITVFPSLLPRKYTKLVCISQAKTLVLFSWKCACIGRKSREIGDYTIKLHSANLYCGWFFLHLFPPTTTEGTPIEKPWPSKIIRRRQRKPKQVRLGTQKWGETWKIKENKSHRTERRKNRAQLKKSKSIDNFECKREERKDLWVRNCRGCHHHIHIRHFEIISI